MTPSMSGWPTLDGEVLAWIYLLDAYEGGLPSARYLGVVADAAEAAGAPDEYVTDLRLGPARRRAEAPVPSRQHGERVRASATV